MTFRVGQKVVCVNAGKYLGQEGMCWYDGEAIFEGSVYTITGLFSHSDISLCRLAEVSRHPLTLEIHGHDGYGTRRFRPVVEKKTDLSIFTAMLTGTKVDA